VCISAEVSDMKRIAGIINRVINSNSLCI